MKLLLKRIIENRDTLAICCFLFGSPVIYYLRDGVGLAPNNMMFTVALLFGPLFMVFPFRNLNSFYNPNQTLYLLSFIFFFIILFSLYFNDRLPFSRKMYEFSVILLIIYIYVHLTTMSKDNMNQYFLQSTLGISLIGCLLLIYYVYNNPLYVFGQRASINLNKEGEDFSGNPHIFSKGAFYGIVAGAVLFKYAHKKFERLIILVSFAIFFFVLILTQTMAAYLATGIFVMVFVFFNVTVRKVYKSASYLVRKWYFWAAFLFLTYKGVTVFQNQKAIFDTSFLYFQSRFTGIFSSIFGGKEDTGDDSANSRVGLVRVVVDEWLENLEDGDYLEIIFGNGYKNLYVDVPLIESLDSFGLVGFFVYALLYFYMIYISVSEVRNPRSPFTEFVAYGFIYFMVLNLTGGLVVDYGRWGYYALVCRFIPISTKRDLSLSGNAAVK